MVSGGFGLPEVSVALECPTAGFRPAGEFSGRRRLPSAALFSQKAPNRPSGVLFGLPNSGGEQISRSKYSRLFLPSFFPAVLCSASGFFGCSTLLAQCLALSVWKVRSSSFLGVAEERFLSD